MKIAFVGCGYVFDIYMRSRWAYPEIEIAGVFDIDTARMGVVSAHYGFRAFSSYDEILEDSSIDIIVNLTSIRSHYEVIKRALTAGKHVYSEKPLTTDLELSRELFDLARSKGLIFTGAPCNLYSDAVMTIWKAVRDGAIGKPVLVYAELDDNPAHLMKLETVQSPTGAPFPYAEELQEGCTVEHVGYHLSWICAIFGPATSVSAYASHLVERKTDTPLDPNDTPDFSVACLTFADGVSARITCSWVAPRDHSMRIIGIEGQISADNAFHDQSPLRLERFSRVSLAGRKFYSARAQPLIGRLFGIGGRAMTLVRRWKSHAVEAERGVGTTLKHRLVSWLRRKEVYAQDKLLGIGEMIRAMEQGQPQPMSPDYLLHLNELTLLIHHAGKGGAAVKPTTSFAAMQPLGDEVKPSPQYRESYRPARSEAIFAGAVARIHKS